jgi:hypothetical protein
MAERSRVIINSERLNLKREGELKEKWLNFNFKILIYGIRVFHLLMHLVA